MDEIKELKELIPILVFLLPGFLTAKVYALLVITPKKDVFDRVVESFVFTFINLICFAVIRFFIETAMCYRFDRVQLFTPGNLILMIFCAVAIAIACAYETKNENLLEMLRKDGVTKKTYKPSTWLDTFSHVERFVVVHLNDGRRIYGWPRFYSDDPGERAIFLENATWLGDSNEILNVEPISIFLDEKSGIQLIEFLSSHGKA